MSTRTIALAVVGAASLLAGSGPAGAASPEAGRRIVQRNCAVCHAVGPQGESRHPGAPPFRDLHTRYPLEMLEEALAEGMLTGHPDMPEFKFSTRQIDDIMAYLKSIQTHTDAAYARPAPRKGA